MTYTQQGISVTFTLQSIRHTFCVKVKIPSTAARDARTLVIGNKGFELKLVRKRPSPNDIVVCFCQDYVVGKNKDLLCGKPLFCSYEDEFYEYQLTLQPSFYAPPPIANLYHSEKNGPIQRNPRSRAKLTSPRPIPYTRSNISKPYSGGRVASK